MGRGSSSYEVVVDPGRELLFIRRLQRELRALHPFGAGIGNPDLGEALFPLYGTDMEGVWHDHLLPFIRENSEKLASIYRNQMGSGKYIMLFDEAESLMAFERIFNDPEGLVRVWPEPWDSLAILFEAAGVPSPKSLERALREYEAEARNRAASLLCPSCQQRVAVDTASS
jgi:hypothetical protein